MATDGIKQLLFGIVLILFGILVGVIDFPWIPVIGTLNGDLVGVISLLSGISGVIIAARACYSKKEK